MNFRESIFIVTEEYSCPLYKVGEEFVMHDSAMTVGCGKEFCMILMREMLRILAAPGRITQQGMQRSKFECGGCTGLIRFEHKKKKSYSCLQMNLLKAAEQRVKQQPALEKRLPAEAREQREKQRIAAEFFILLRDIEVFEPLNDFDLQELSLMMELKCYPANEVIIKEGERGIQLYVILSGKVAVVKSDREVIAELGRGNIFGEMSLLTGEPAYPSFCSCTAVQLACLNAKDFKLILSRYPTLQVFFYRLMLRCPTNLTNTIIRGDISSDIGFMYSKSPLGSSASMSGELTEINSIVDLLQVINSRGKTGKVDLMLPAGNACVLFHEGEIIQASYGNLQGKEALFALISQQKGRFTYIKGLTEEEKLMPILGGFMGLIMEGLQHLEERMDEREE